MKKTLSLLLTTLSLLIRVGDYWRAWLEVGKTYGHLRAKVGEASLLLPPVQGWEYFANSGEWKSDPTIVCSRQVSPASSQQ